MKHYVRNIKTLLRNASFKDISEGMTWYEEANARCHVISSTYDIPLYKVVGVLAALSPRNKWERNLVDCENLIAHRENATVATFNKMKQKALNVLDASDYEDVIRILNGQKIVSFFKNIYHNECTYVTVDVWAMRAAGFTENLTTKKYLLLQEVYRQVAKEYEVQPKQLQAIAWQQIRNKTNNTLKRKVS